MTTVSPRKRLDAIQEGLQESALLAALGYDASQGRPGRILLNNALERLGYGRPIDEQGSDRLLGHRSYPDEWVRAIVKAVAGRPDAPLGEVIVQLKQRASRPVRAG